MLSLKPLHPEISPLSVPYLFVTWFHSGRIGPVPGTWGSLAALPACWFVRSIFNWEGLLAFFIVTSVLAVWAVHRYIVTVKHPDPSEVVIDEVLGMTIIGLLIPFSLLYWIAGFFLFRFLDGSKPGLIGFCDRRLKGAAGIMMDDVLAGFATGAILLVLSRMI